MSHCIIGLCFLSAFAVITRRNVYLSLSHIFGVNIICFIRLLLLASFAVYPDSSRAQVVFCLHYATFENPGPTESWPDICDTRQYCREHLPFRDRQSHDASMRLSNLM